MDLLDRLLAQLGALPAVWMPVLLTVAVVAVVTWRISQHLNSQRLAAKEDLLHLREAQLQDYKDKLSGATPDEAKARLDALEARVVRVEPRQLTPAQVQRMRPSLDPLAGSRITITSDAASADAAIFAEALASVFRASGWQPWRPAALGLNPLPPTGLGLYARDSKALSHAQSAIAGALRKAGIDFDILPEHARGDAPPELIVTTRGPD